MMLYLIDLKINEKNITLNVSCEFKNTSGIQSIIRNVYNNIIARNNPTTSTNNPIVLFN